MSHIKKILSSKASSLLVLCALCMMFIVGCVPQGPKLNLQAQKNIDNVSVQSEAAVGWSVNEDPKAAVAESLSMARGRLGGKAPTFAYVVFTARADDTIVDEVRSQLGDGVKMVGITSKLGVMTNDGLHVGANGSIAILLVAAKDITFGVGEVDINNFSTPQEAGKAAMKMSIADAKNQSGQPDIVLYIGTTRRGDEMRILDGIAEVIPSTVPVIGGNSNDDKIAGLWKQITSKKTYETVLILVSIYTNRSIGWGFDTGFKLTDNKGIVTKSDGLLISEIDNRPALDVYNEWTDGEFYKKLDAGEFNDANGNISFDKIKTFTLLNPIARVLRTQDGRIGHYTISPIPNSDDIKNKQIRVFAEIQQGWEIALYKGTWQTHMNKAEIVPKNALDRAGLSQGKGIFSIIQFCNGLRSQIPPEEFEKIPAITDDALGGIPFIGAVTSGEQGPLPEVGRNVNANLIECVMVAG